MGDSSWDEEYGFYERDYSVARRCSAKDIVSVVLEAQRNYYSEGKGQDCIDFLEDYVEKWLSLNDYILRCEPK